MQSGLLHAALYKQCVSSLIKQVKPYAQAYVKAHAAQTATGPDAAAKSEAATAKLEEYESLSTTDALRYGQRHTHG